jgi:hypothetical protein
VAAPSAVAQQHRTPLPVTLDSDVRRFDLDDLEAKLPALPAGVEHDYFAGIFANGAGHFAESASLLEKSIHRVTANRRERLKQGLYALVYDYVNLYRYADAFRTYKELAKVFPDAGKDDDYGIFQLLRDAPGQSIQWHGPVHLKTEKSPLGSIDIDLTVNGITSPWLLDTGANFSVVSASFAKRLGLEPLPGVAATRGSTGVENRLRAGILRELKIGSATVHNVVVLIIDDAAMTIPIVSSKAGPDGEYQIPAVIGLPVFQALGAVTVTHDGELEAGSAVAQSGPSSRVFMHRMDALLECGIDRKKLLFLFDSGANSSTFSSRYYKAFPAQFSSAAKVDSITAGAGGSKHGQTYVLRKLDVDAGGRNLLLPHVTVEPDGPTSNATYGTLGRDLASSFESFTLNLSSMTFQLGNPLTPTAH